MKKFIKDVLEVCKDIKNGVYHVVVSIVIFFWAIGTILEERQQKNKIEEVIFTPVTLEVRSNVVSEE